MVRSLGRDEIEWVGGIYVEEGISSQLRALSSPSLPMLLLLQLQLHSSASLAVLALGRPLGLSAGVSSGSALPSVLSSTAQAEVMSTPNPVACSCSKMASV